MASFSKQILFSTLFFISLFFTTACADELLSIEIWCELDPMVYDATTPSPLSEAEAEKRIFEEARGIFGGMIYGYGFSYIPYDKTRGVPESFEIAPIAEIPWGDKNLKLTHTELTEKRLYARLTYQLEDFQYSRIKSWETLSIPYEMGKGEGKLFLGMGEKKTASSMASKDAIRNFLRPTILNKPREIRGEVLFLECPSTIIEAGAYITTVKIKINIKEIIPYTIY